MRLLLVAVGLIVACGDTISPAGTPDAAAVDAPHMMVDAAPPMPDADPTSRPGWELVWHDEFDGAGAPNPANWGYEVGYLRNNEQQYYTDDRRENARVENGSLVIEARNDNFDGHAITSASLTTAGKASFRYGRIEVRAKIPTGNGTWPAIWTLGTNIGDVGWPTCGEIDIMENVGFVPPTIYGTVHMGAGAHGGNVDITTPWTDFHVYAVEWYTDRIDFFVDDQKYFTYLNDGSGTASWPFDADQYLILNLAIGGSWGGQMGVDLSLFPHLYYIDYVRVYRKQP